MTSDEYLSIITSLGLSPARSSFEGRTVNKTPGGGFLQVANPETLTDDEKEDMIELIKSRLAIIAQ